MRTALAGPSTERVVAHVELPYHVPWETAGRMMF
jgi:hypothetical protein